MWDIFLNSLNDPSIHIDLMAINDSGSKLLVYSNRLEIQFVDERKPRVFNLDIKSLYDKIDCLCHEVCFDHKKPGRRKLMFELDWLKCSPLHTIRISILNGNSDNFRIEVSRSELLASLAFFFK